MHRFKILFFMTGISFYTLNLVCSDNVCSEEFFERTASQEAAMAHLAGQRLAGNSIYGARTQTQRKLRPPLFPELSSPFRSDAPSFPQQTPIVSTEQDFPVAWHQDFDEGSKVKHGRSFFGVEVSSQSSSRDASGDANPGSPISRAPEMSVNIQVDQVGSFVVIPHYIDSLVSSENDSSKWETQAQRDVRVVPAKSCWECLLVFCSCAYVDREENC